MEPKAYLNLIGREWSLVEFVHRATQHGPIDSHELFGLAGVHAKADDPPEKIIRNLIQAGILYRPIEEEDLFELGDLAREIVEKLIEQHRLGLAESITVYIKELERHGNRLREAVLTHQSEDVLALSLRDLRSLIETIRSQARSNLVAINNIVDRAKQQEGRRPVRDRYAEAINTWEDYIVPMGGLIDPAGPFSHQIDHVQGLLRESQHHLEERGRYPRVEELRRLEQMTRSMRAELIRQFDASRNALKPVYDAARMSTTVARGAALALTAFRRGQASEGMSIALHARTNAGRPLVSSNDALLALMSGLVTADSEPPPRINLQPPTSAPRAFVPVNEDTLRRRLRADLPVGNLFGWLDQTFSDRSLDEVLRLAVAVLEDPLFDCTRQELIAYRLASTTVHHARIEVREVSS